mgnify:CR=1 FL=1
MRTFPYSSAQTHPTPPSPVQPGPAQHSRSSRVHASASSPSPSWRYSLQPSASRPHLDLVCLALLPQLHIVVPEFA